MGTGLGWPDCILISCLAGAASSHVPSQHCPPCWANRGHVQHGAGSSTTTHVLQHFRSSSVYLLLVCQGLTSSDDGKQGSVVRVNPSKEMQNMHAPAMLSGLAPKSDSRALVAFLFPLLCCGSVSPAMKAVPDAWEMPSASWGAPRSPVNRSKSVEAAGWDFLPVFLYFSQEWKTKPNPKSSTARGTNSFCALSSGGRGPTCWKLRPLTIREQMGGCSLSVLISQLGPGTDDMIGARLEGNLRRCLFCGASLRSGTLLQGLRVHLGDAAA